MSTPSAPARVLAVCTANRCRSPMMEYLLRHAVTSTDAEPWDVHSAGTRAVDDLPMDPEALAVLARRGIDASGFRSRRLSAAMIDGAELIVTADAAHRAAVVAIRPDAVQRTFTLLQFARLLDAGADAGHGTARALVAAAQRARSRSRPGDDELDDPIGRPAAVFEATAGRIERAVATVSARRGAATVDAEPTILRTPLSETL